MATKLIQPLKDHPGISAKKLVPWVNTKLGLVLPYMRVYRAKIKAEELMGGNPEEAYMLAPKYREMVLRTNVGSVVVIDVKPVIDRPPQFQRMFCGLEGIKRGFLNGCQPFLFFDGCYLRGRFGGHLLSAIATYADCGIYPVAWAIVDSENKESWGFFIQCLENFVGPFDVDRHWHFMADRCKVES